MKCRFNFLYPKISNLSKYAKQGLKFLLLKIFLTLQMRETQIRFSLGPEILYLLNKESAG